MVFVDRLFIMTRLQIGQAVFNQKDHVFVLDPAVTRLEYPGR